MRIKILLGSGMIVGLMGLGVLAGSVIGSGDASAQTAVTTPKAAAPAQPAQPAQPSQSAPAPAQPSQSAPAQPAPAQPSTATITQQQAEQAALASSPGATVDHSRLGNENGTAAWDVDFTNGGGAIVDAQTGKVISTEAAGADKGGRGGPRGGGPDQAALAAKAKITQQQAEQAALTASPGNTVDHSRLGGDPNGTVFWDVDFTNGGGAEVNAETGAIIKTEAAGTDMGGHRGGSKDAPESAPSTTP